MAAAAIPSGVLAGGGFRPGSNAEAHPSAVCYRLEPFLARDAAVR